MTIARQGEQGSWALSGAGTVCVEGFGGSGPRSWVPRSERCASAQAAGRRDEPHSPGTRRLF